MNNLFKPVLTILIAVGFASCNVNLDRKITGSGNVTTQTRQTGDAFTKISASNGLEVTIEQNANTSVVVEADDNLQSHIHTSVANGTLTISCDFNNFRNVKSKKVTVKLPKVNGIEAQSGVSLSSQGVLTSDDFTIEASSGSNVDVNVESDKVVAQTSSGSHMTLKGKALTLDTSSSSGSGIEAGNLIANDVTAQASSGSSAEVHAAVSIQASASSGGSVEYKGNPKNVTKDQSSGGSISAN